MARNQRKKLILKPAYFLLCILLMPSCNRDVDYDIVVTDTAINLGKLNSSFDDYNSDVPHPSERMEIFFSSNRTPKNKFDIVWGKLDFSFYSKDKVLNASVPNDDTPPMESVLLFPKVNSPENEYGPHSFRVGNNMLFFYATDIDGGFEIRFVEVANENSGLQSVSDPISLSGLNADGDNLYPCVDAGKKTIYFCTNRAGAQFDIYSAVYNSEISRQSLEDNDIQQISKEVALSSDFDDKCPYVKDDFMVFTSNRDGNYDLWYSKRSNGTWSEPLKFDERINSDFNEYRPVILKVLNFDLMIFSSDRPGGSGGYDLYIVKIDSYKK